MNESKGYNHRNPVYTTKSEVLTAAYENADFFESYSESLKHAWTFYF